MITTQRNKQDRIVRIPGVLGGKPVISGTRIPVDMILERLTFDLDLKTLFEEYPDLTEEDIKACIAYAKELLEDEEAFEEQKLEQMLLEGIRSQRGMEIGSTEWKEFRKRLVTQTIEGSKHEGA
jgi:uncharacterized protein (DUF433 family)